MQAFHRQNFKLGHVAGVRVRLHRLFLALAAAPLIVFVVHRDAAEALWWASFLAVLLVSTLLHEIGHCMAARRRGGAPHEMILWPLGGLVQISVPPSPTNEIAVASAGPLVNLMIAAAAGGILVASGIPFDGLSLALFEPPMDSGGLTWLVVVKLAIWINLWVFAINLLPALPLDGGRAARGVLWKMLGHRRAQRYCHGLARISGAVLCLSPAVLRGAGVVWASFVEIPLILLGVFLLFNPPPAALRRRENVSDDELFSDADEFRSELDDSSHGHPSATRQAVEVRLAEKLRRQQEFEAEEDRRVDEILSRLGETGLEGLSPEDRELLERVSERYRGERREGGRE